MIDNLEIGPVAEEVRAERIAKLRPGQKQCKSRLAGLRCMKLAGHGGQHVNRVVRVVRSARWD